MADPRFALAQSLLHDGFAEIGHVVTLTGLPEGLVARIASGEVTVGPRKAQPGAIQKPGAPGKLYGNNPTFVILDELGDARRAE